MTADAASEPAKVWHPMDGDAFGGLGEDGEPVMPAQEKLAHDLAAGLRAVAEFIEQNPALAKGFKTDLVTSGIKVHPGAADQAAALAQYAQAAARFGAKVTKDIDDTWHNVVMHFGVLKAEVLAFRSEVCERVVTGTETVTKKVKDPEALAAVPEVEVTEEVETFEWVCRPLLADDSSAVAS